MEKVRVPLRWEPTLKATCPQQNKIKKSLNQSDIVVKILLCSIYGNKQWQLRPRHLQRPRSKKTKTHTEGRTNERRVLLKDWVDEIVYLWTSRPSPQSTHGPVPCVQEKLSIKSKGPIEILRHHPTEKHFLSWRKNFSSLYMRSAST